ncbi:MAG: DUF3048 domain-containing protein [Anaerolineales bacterium]
MHCSRSNIALILMILLSACGIRSNDVPISGIASPTPFQPMGENVSDSLYAGPAPTPGYLPSVPALLSPPTETAVQPESVPEGVNVLASGAPVELNPLTGLPASNPALLERRPLAIKVANYPRYIRPQSGLTLADNVFEYYIEAGLTRFIAVFYGNDSEWVGPVRSGRYFDEHIQRMYHAWLVFKFADPRVESHLQESDVAPFLVVPSLGSCPPFSLMPERHIEVYNNSYFNTVRWADCVARDGLENERQPLRSGLFSEDVPPADLSGTQMYTYYSEDSYNYWIYQPETQQYLRYQETDDIRNNKPEKYHQLIDAVTDEPVHASNVVFLFAPHTFSNPFDEEDEVFQIDLGGSGEAYVFRDGVGIPARWMRTSREQLFVLISMSGEPIHFRPGITFYEVLGTASYVDQDAGEWHFHHATP